MNAGTFSSITARMSSTSDSSNGATAPTPALFTGVVTAGLVANSRSTRRGASARPRSTASTRNRATGPRPQPLGQRVELALLRNRIALA